MEIDNKIKLRLVLLFMFIFMIGVFVGLWATKNTFKHCTEDLDYCVDKYREDCAKGINLFENNMSGLNQYGGNIKWNINKSLT